MRALSEKAPPFENDNLSSARRARLRVVRPEKKKRIVLILLYIYRYLTMSFKVQFRLYRARIFP